MEVIFWGSRGSVPCFSKQKVHFGTNTSCLEINIPGEEKIVFDAGTGIVSLGTHLEHQGLKERETIHLFFSHFHWDHIQGLPFFKPVYKKDWTVILYGQPGRPCEAGQPDQPGIEGVFSTQMMEPFFPLKFEQLPAKMVRVPITDPVELKRSRITPFPLNHPQGCYGYIVETDGCKFVYATDTEPDGGEMDALLLEKAHKADVLAMDAQNSLEETPKRKGWGHSSWEDCIRVAREAGVRRLVLFHHDPFHDDHQVQDKQRQAQRLFPDTICSYEGLRIRIDAPEVGKVGG